MNSSGCIVGEGEGFCFRKQGRIKGLTAVIRSLESANSSVPFVIVPSFFFNRFSNLRKFSLWREPIPSRDNAGDFISFYFLPLLSPWSNFVANPLFLASLLFVKKILLLQIIIFSKFWSRWNRLNFYRKVFLGFLYLSKETNGSIISLNDY